METASDARFDKIEARFDKIEASQGEIKSELVKITRFSLLDPRGIAVVVAIILAGGSFVTGIWRGDSPEQAAQSAVQSVQQVDPLLQAILSGRLVPTPAQDAPEPDPRLVDPASGRP